MKKTVSIRLRPENIAKLKKLAAEGRRSLSEQLDTLIETASTEAEHAEAEIEAEIKKRGYQLLG